MSFTDDYDQRFALSFYEVHYWPHEGRILTVNKESHRAKPILMELHVTGASTEVSLGDDTAVTAYVLAGAGNPPGDLVMHLPSGDVMAFPADTVAWGTSFKNEMEVA